MQILPIFGIVLLSIAGSSRQTNVLAQVITSSSPTSNLNGAPLTTTTSTASAQRVSCPLCPVPGPDDGPVCGTNGITYESSCLLFSASCQSTWVGKGAISELYKGPCKVTTSSPSPSRAPCIIFTCPPSIDPPVCGTDGKTYRGNCLLINASCRSKLAGNGEIKFVHDGPCTESTPRSSPTVPVSNRFRSCISFTCPPRIEPPICGTDGKTHRGTCFLKMASCRSVIAGHGEINLLHDGPCKESTPAPSSSPPIPIPIPIPVPVPVPSPSNSMPIQNCPRICNKKYEPVCGDNGRTYGNSCMFDSAKCRNATLTKLYNGRCKVTTPSSSPPLVPCPDCPPSSPNDRAVCGANGKTYGSSCLLFRASCQSEHAGKGAIRGLFIGPCEVTTPFPSPSLSGSTCNVTVCPIDDSVASIHPPVCGTDGKTYRDTCELENASCVSTKAGKSRINLLYDLSQRYPLPAYYSSTVSQGLLIHIYMFYSKSHFLGITEIIKLVRN
jgi:hypothetical protein